MQVFVILRPCVMPHNDDRRALLSLAMTADRQNQPYTQGLINGYGAWHTFTAHNWIYAGVMHHQAQVR